MKKENMKKRSPFGQEGGFTVSTKKTGVQAADLKELMNPSNMNFFGSGSIHEC